MYVIDVQQQQINADMMIDANAAITLLEKRAQKIFRLERDSNTRPLRYGCNAFPTELSKSHESSCVWVGPLCSVDLILGLKYVNSIVRARLSGKNVGVSWSLSFQI